MDQNTFDVMIENFQKFAREIFSPDCEDKFKVKLMEALEQIMRMGRNLNFEKVGSMESNPAKKIKLDQTLNKVLDLPDEIWTKIIKYLPSKDVYGTLTLVNKRFQSLALDSGVLRIINIDPYINEEKMLNILRHSTAPTKLISPYFNRNAISLTKNLKSLELRNTSWENAKFDDIDYQIGEEFYMSYITALEKSNAELEHLELHGHYVPLDVMIEISKIKTLKTFQISNARDVVITPEVVNALAQNENQLEIIEFDDFDDEDFWVDIEEEQNDELIKALNNLLNRKSKTLKSLKNITWDGLQFVAHNSKVPLTNLKLCQNLQEFYGRLQQHDIEILAELPRLQKLTLEGLENPKYLLDNLNLGSLKYLSLFGTTRTTENETIICKELQKHYFPVLERLSISVYNSVALSEDFFSNLISNAPKLKSIKLGPSSCPVSQEFMYNFFKNSDIFVSFNSTHFEDFLIEKDLIVFRKYKRMKKSFQNWIANK